VVGGWLRRPKRRSSQGASQPTAASARGCEPVGPQPGPRTARRGRRRANAGPNRGPASRVAPARRGEASEGRACGIGRSPISRSAQGVRARSQTAGLGRGQAEAELPPATPYYADGVPDGGEIGGKSPESQSSLVPCRSLDSECERMKSKIRNVKIKTSSCAHPAQLPGRAERAKPRLALNQPNGEIPLSDFEKEMPMKVSKLNRPGKNLVLVFCQW